MSPAYSGLPDFARAVGVYYAPAISQSTWRVVAPLPFGMQPGDSTVIIDAPPASVPELRVRAFCDGAPAHDVCLTESDTPGRLIGRLCWPEPSNKAQAYLYYSGEEIGSITVSRWSGTQNWRITVDRYFDEEQRRLEAQLQTKSESQEFEQGIVRLLALLGLAPIWYGSKHFRSKPDLAAFSKFSDKRFVVLGECTGQKPASKFTPLLARAEELRISFGMNPVTIFPVVFTPCDVSPADTRDASQDGIIVVGKPQLLELLDGARNGWGPWQLLRYLESLLTPTPPGAFAWED